MVEEGTYNILESGKYCNEDHIPKLVFFCTNDKILCCEECASEHLHHVENLKSIKSIFESRIPKYRELKDVLLLLSKNVINSDEIRSYIAQKLECAFDNLMSRIREMKGEWICEQFNLIMKEFGVEKEIEQARKIRSLLVDIEETFTKIQCYVNLENSENYKEVAALTIPEEYSSRVQEARENIGNINKIKSFEINTNLTQEQLTGILHVTGLNGKNNNELNVGNHPPPPPLIIYSGSILGVKELIYIVKELPSEVKELKMLFSTKIDGDLAATFHSKCDGMADTLIVALGGGNSQEPRIFGGFAHPPWHSRSEWTADLTRSSFLFSSYNQTRHSITNYNSAIYGHPNYGPAFGSGYDWVIYNDMTGFVKLGSSYHIPKGGIHSDYMAGTPLRVYFTHIHYEVHQVIFQ